MPVDDEGYCTFCYCKPCECRIRDDMEDSGIVVTSVKPEPRMGGKSATDVLKENHQALINAAIELREAQKDYIANRGNDALGKIVGKKAEVLDSVLKRCQQ